MSLYITEEEVAGALDIPSAIEAVERAMIQLASGEARVIVRRRARTRGGLFHLLAGASEADGVHGLKAYTTGKGGARFYVFLFNSAGELEATIEADHLGRMRTGAASGVATRYLSRPDARRLLIIGSGQQATAQVMAVAHVRPVEQVEVWSRTEEHRERFAHQLSKEAGLDARAVSDPQFAALHCDIITTVTTAIEPVLEADWISPGTHINACGSNSLKRVELDPFVLEKADCVCADLMEQARLESGDMANAEQAGVFHWEEAVELANVVSGRFQGRSSPEDITLFESHGLGIWDVACAKVVVDRIRGERTG
ncbi:MAG: ornithine cyclodeaminase family protein [Armatimonadetes bacterium]|nr:ornithine cyclodeaminase family protein [Armatimonadota bacterium]